MTGPLILAVVALAIVAALELSHRRNTTPATGPSGGWIRDDRDVARTKLDLLAAGAKAEPFSHKPFRGQGTSRGASLANDSADSR